LFETIRLCAAGSGFSDDNGSSKMPAQSVYSVEQLALRLGTDESEALRLAAASGIAPVSPPSRPPMFPADAVERLAARRAASATDEPAGIIDVPNSSDSSVFDALELSQPDGSGGPGLRPTAPLPPLGRSGPAPVFDDPTGSTSGLFDPVNDGETDDTGTDGAHASRSGKNRSAGPPGRTG
jgi:hypothetical protein